MSDRSPVAQTKAILTDVSRCIGCARCVDACTNQNGLGKDVAYRWRERDGLSAQRFTAVVRHRSGYYVRKQCRHCLHPACVSACPVGALKRTAEGAVVYDSSRCLGCRYCMMACPFGIPRYDWASPAPTVRKCSMCWESRLAAGRQPACTEACPEKATVFGERDVLIAEARRRIAAAPDRYRPTVFGETDVGGTAVLYLSPIDLSFLGLGNAQGAAKLPERTSVAMGAVPWAFGGMVTLMGGLWWMIERRERLQSERRQAAAGESEEDEHPSPLEAGADNGTAGKTIGKVNSQ
ncbi:MAG: 4Fe-4S dicluster domain-containing protein [Pseudomonadota bacterium]